MKNSKFIEILTIIFLLAFCMPTFADDVNVIPTITDITPNSGTTAGGTRVTISGSYFDGGLTIKFGKQFGTVVRVVPMQIIVFTPTGPGGPVDVVVTNPNGLLASRPKGFTYLTSLTPPTVNAGDNQDEDEGDQVTISAEFADNLGDKPHTAEIDWGDGTVTPGVVQYSSVFSIPITTGIVTGSHVYGDNGDYVVAVTVTDKDGASGSDDLMVEIDNEDPRTPNISNKTLAEGDPTLELTVTFTDEGWLDTHTVGIYWGDGDAEIIQTATSPLTRSHTYRGDDRQYSARVEVIDDDGGEDKESFLVTVRNEDPVIAPIDDQSILEGDPTVSLSISFTDPGLLDTHRATISWGDGDVDAIDPAISPIIATHTYAKKDDAQYSASVTIIDDDGGQATEEFKVSVTNEDPVIAPIDDQSIEECDATISLSIVITDPGQDTYKLTIGWGDGKTEEIYERVSSPAIVTYTYDLKDDAQYTVGVAVEDYDGGSDTESFVVTVMNKAPVISTDLADQTVSECNPAVGLRVSFLDCGPGDTHTAMIDWGDGTVEPGDLTEAVVSGVVNGAVIGSHTYIRDDATGDGAYTVTVTVEDNDGGIHSKSFVVRVINEDPIIQTELENRTISECDPTVDLQAGFVDCGLLDTHIARINWGDGVVEPADVTVVVIGGTISGTVIGSHTYARDDATGSEAYTVTVTVADDDGGLHSKSFIVTVINENPVIQTEPENQTISECDPTVNLELDFFDCGSRDTHTAMINWGDGQETPGNVIEEIVADGVSGIALGSHTYARDDATGSEAYTVTVTVADDDGGLHSKSLLVTVTNEAPVIQAELSDQTISECNPTVDLQVGFIDCGLDTHTATINWGDGQETPGNVIEEVGADGVSGIVVGSHTYIKDDATGGGAYTVTVTVEDDNGGVDSVSFVVSVANEAPVIQTGPSDQITSECDPTVNLEVDFFDCGLLDTHTAMINWGDGQETPGNVIEEAIADGVSGTVTASHTYIRDDATGNEAYTVIVTVEDNNGGVDSMSFMVNVVNEAPVIRTELSDQTVSECDPTVNLELDFFDCGSLDTHTSMINWGDGQETPGDLTEEAIADGVSGAVTASHTYIRDDATGNEAYTVMVTVEDDNGGVDSMSFVVTVVNEAPVIQTELPDQIVSEGDPTVNLELIFTDCDSLDTHTAVMNWGDGNEDTIDPAISPLFVSHTYLGDDGLYTVVVTITDDNGGMDTESFQVTVINENPVIATIDDQNILGSNPVVNLSIGFTDPGELDTHSMTINWDDGTEDVIDPATSPESASHTYPIDNMQYEVSIVLVDDDGGENTELFIVTVTNDAPVIDPISDQSVPESQPTISISASFTDLSENDAHSAIIDWGDGKGSSFDPAISPITSTHTYTGDDGQYKATVTVTDKDGGIGVESFIVIVTNENPVVEAIDDQNLNEGSPVYTLNAIFADPGILDTHKAAIIWGDGKEDTIDPVTSPISIEHNYPGDDGQYKASITVIDKDGGEMTRDFTVTVNNEAPAVDPIGDQSILEGNPTVAISFSFTDPGELDTHTAIIDWGDDDVTTIDLAVSPIEATHTYLGDDGQYEVSIILQDDDGGNATELFTVIVDNQDPIIIPMDNQIISESDPTAVISVIFFDPGMLDTHTATIDWGDGDVETVENATIPITIAHPYPGDLGEYAVSVTVTDDDNGSSVESLIVTKISENPFIDPVDDQRLNEGEPIVSLIIDFREAEVGPPSWSQSGLVAFKPSEVSDGIQEQTAFHTDTSGPGAWLQFDTGIGTRQDFVRVEITAYLTPPKAIWDVQYSDSGDDWTTAFSGAGGHPFGPGTFVYEWGSVGAHRYWRLYKTDEAAGGGYHSEVQFSTETNTIPENSHAAKIVWGDGDSDDINPAVSPINAKHTYPYDNGAYTATVTIIHTGGGMHTRSFRVTVDNVAPVVDAGDDQRGDIENPVIVEASFADVGLLDTHTATIDWGDDTVDESATVKETNGSGAVTGSHIYTDGGRYTITVSVIDDDKAMGRDDFIVDVISGPAPVVTEILPDIGTIDGGTAVTITGRNFQIRATVRIGNTNATNVQFISDTQIKAITPPGPIGPANVTVTNPDNQSGTLLFGFIYIGPVVKLSIPQQTVTVQKGETWQFTVTGTDSAGTPVPIEDTDVNWGVADTSVGNIGPAGLFTAIDHGEAKVTVTLKKDTSISAEAAVNVPDTEPPSVLSEEIFPASEIPHVPVTASIPIIFSEPVDMESIESGGLKVTGQDNRLIEGDYEFDPDKGILTFIPSEPFKDEETITIAVTAAVMDLAGNNLEEEFQVSFTTGIGLRPGDTNNDGQVNTQDVIPLGQYWNRIGQRRDGATSEWELQSAVPWEPYRMATYADANGDGKVDQQDILPIAINWRRLHTPNWLAPPSIADKDSVPEDTQMLDVYSAMYDVLDTAPVETEGVLALKAAIGEMMVNIRRRLSPRESKLLQNYPNPFNPETWIPYQLAEEVSVRINIYNLSGRLVRTLEIGQSPAGYYLSKEKAAYWDGKNQFGEQVASGIYFYHIKAGAFESVRKLINIQ